MEYEINTLQQFLNEASTAAYAGSGKPIDNPERPGFIELVYESGDFSYRDSYAGHSRSRGMEVIRHKGVPIWASTYGGGMTDGNGHVAQKTFGFLKQVLSVTETGFMSLRGPHQYEDGEWRYTYAQKGDLAEFTGHEEIYYQGSLVFFHEVIGGIIDNM